MAVICDDCGREIEKHEPRHMYNKTTGRSYGPFHSGYTSKRVPICEQCWQRRKKRQLGCILILVVIVGGFCFTSLFFTKTDSQNSLSQTNQAGKFEKPPTRVSVTTPIPIDTTPSLSPTISTKLPTVQSPTTTNTDTYTPTPILIQITSNVGAYVRNGPGAEYDVAGTVEADRVFKLLAYYINPNSDAWYLIELDSENIAWVSEWVSAPQGTVEVAAIPTAVTIPSTPTQKPVIRIGDTIPEFNPDNPQLSLSLLSWKTSNIAVEGPYIGGYYYTFTAKPGMKFVILIFKFQNNSIRPQDTPYLDTGEVEVLTNKGYFYPIWDSPAGAVSEEYNPREATDYELKTLAGSSAAYEKLLPEQSIVGRIVFEIPQSETPIEAHIESLPYPVKLEE